MGKNSVYHYLLQSVIFIYFSNRYINYCMKIINLLLQHEIIPIIVFDGADLPIKDGTNSKRKEYLNFIQNISLENVLSL